MLENILVLNKVNTKTKIAIKTLIAIGLVACAVGLPQIVHLFAGAQGGMFWLPMYLPVLIGGCLLGTWWGLGIGVMSPICSFLITSLTGNAMPALARLPFMVVELAVFAVVAGLFSKKIADNKWLAFPAVLLAQLSGRLSFIIMTAIFGGLSNLSIATVLSQIQAGLIGLYLQAIIVPLIIIGLSTLLKREKHNDR